jgi:6-phospho-beta-glucosidase
VITTTSDLDASVAGADAVLLQLRVGGQTARHRDESWPHDCGCIGQETTGPGGLAKALRTVPVVLDIADRVTRSNPNAWIIDFTNPVGIVTRALLKAGHRAVGLCNVAIGFQRQFAQELGVEPERVVIDQVGLNHLTWVRHVWVDGRDVLPEALETRGETIASQLDLPWALVRELGVIPSYYLHYFYAHDEVLARQQAGEKPRAQAVAEIEADLLQMYRDPHLDEKPALLEQRGGAFYSEAAIGLVGSIATSDDAVHVVDVRNEGALAGLQDDDVVELPARVSASGAAPLPQSPLAPEFLGLVQHVAAYERLAAEAAVTRDRATARKALLSHPLVGQWSMTEELVERVLDVELQETNA